MKTIGLLKPNHSGKQFQPTGTLQQPVLAINQAWVCNLHSLVEMHLLRLHHSAQTHKSKIWKMLNRLGHLGKLTQTEKSSTLDSRWESPLARIAGADYQSLNASR